VGFSGGEGGFYIREVRVSEVFIGGDISFFVQIVVNETALI